MNEAFIHPKGDGMLVLSVPAHEKLHDIPGEFIFWTTQQFGQPTICWDNQNRRCMNPPACAASPNHCVYKK